VALTQLLLEPVEVKVQGLDPCSEVRVRYGPWFHTIVAPVGRLLTVNEAPEEQIKEGPLTVPVGLGIPNAEYAKVTFAGEEG